MLNTFSLFHSKEIEKIISSCTTNTFTDNDVKTFVSPRVSLHQWLTDADSSLVQTALLLTKRITFFLDERFFCL